VISSQSGGGVTITTIDIQKETTAGWGTVLARYSTQIGYYSLLSNFADIKQIRIITFEVGAATRDEMFMTLPTLPDQITYLDLFY